MNNDAMYLRHMLGVISRIEACTAVGRDRLMDEWLLQEAAIRQFEIIGEATKRLSLDVRRRRPEIEWQRVAGLRDVLIHNYMNGDLNVVWDISRETMPVLRQAIEAILAEESHA